MNQLHICIKLYNNEYRLNEKEIDRVERRKKLSGQAGILLIIAGVVALIFPISKIHFSVDDIYKFTTILFGGLFYASVNLYNRVSLLDLKKRQSDIRVLLSMYEGFAGLSMQQQSDLENNCRDKIKQI